MRALAAALVLFALCDPRGARANALTAEEGPGAARTGFERAAAMELDAREPLPPSLSLPTPGDEALAFRFGRRRARHPALGDSAARAAADSTERVARAREPALGAARAQAVLRSLTVPGWGQSTLGHPTAAAVFGLIEAGVWTSYVSFRVQEGLRTSTFERTAKLFAGIDVKHRDEEFRRIVGQYSSSDAYNQFVVRRDAANIYLADPNHLDYDGYHAYIAAHQLQGADTWNWDSFESAQRYRSQRKIAQRAALRANTALALALVNRLVSVLHVSRLHGAADAHPRSWNFEVTPEPGTEPTAFRFGVRTRF
jgi:hypothetical protein